MVERSRALTASDAVFDLEPDHTADAPRLRRVTSPVDQHPDYWEYARESLLADVAADLVGPDVKFHHSKLNFKWARGGEEVKWHQDIQYWPHTNYSPSRSGSTCTTAARSRAAPRAARQPRRHALQPLRRRRHLGGCPRGRDARRRSTPTPADLTGPAGSVTIHNCRTAQLSPATNRPTRPTTAAERVHGRRRVRLHVQPPREPRRSNRARKAGAVGSPRSAAVPVAARLVGGYTALRPAAEGVCTTVDVTR